MNWQEYFMRHVYLAASKSRDESTNIGAVIVKDNMIVSEGYNGLPRGINYYDAKLQERPEKYFWFEHGERNAIYNCARNGISLVGAEMYTQGLPCADCARGIIQSGIVAVYIHTQWLERELMDTNDKWKESCLRSKMMLEAAGVKIVELDIPLGLTAKRNGKVFQV